MAKDVERVAPARQDLLATLGSFTLRSEGSESDSNNLETFVQLIDFAALATPNTQVIYGRHGTGKTHLFKAFYQNCISEFETASSPWCNPRNSGDTD
jgi:DNA replication protein DnaC